MSKKHIASKVSEFLGYATLGRSAARATEIAAADPGFRFVDMRLNMAPGPPIMVFDMESGPPVLFLDELQNAASAPDWIDDEGVVHESLGESGVATLRAMFEDRRLSTRRLGFDGIVAAPIEDSIVASGVAAVHASFEDHLIQKHGVRAPRA